jgi:hypothetical protein
MTSLRTKRYVLRAGLILLCGILLAATGCKKKPSTYGENPPGFPPVPEGEQKRPTLPMAPPGKSELTGKITHKGEPIVAGSLFFIHEKGIVMMPGRIARDGTYKAFGLPTGPVRIFVILDPKGEMPFPAPMEPTLHPRPGGGGEGGPRGGPPGGMPGRKPGGANGPPMPEGGPPTLPPIFARRIKDFKVPPDKQELYQELHEKYGRISDDHVIKTDIKEGNNTLDIDLP